MEKEILLLQMRHQRFYLIALEFANNPKKIREDAYGYEYQRLLNNMENIERELEAILLKETQ